MFTFFVCTNITNENTTGTHNLFKLSDIAIL